MRVEQGKVSDEYDYTSKERFEELELQYRAFKQLFKKEWGKTKARIREDILSKKNDEATDEDSDSKAEENKQDSNDAVEGKKTSSKGKKKKKDVDSNESEEKESVEEETKE